MSNEHNIDKLLKESFENFSPEAPDVWQAVQQGVQAAQMSGAAGAAGSAVTAVKGIGLTVKIISGVILGAAAITGYVFYTSSEKDQVQQPQPVEMTSSVKPIPIEEEKRKDVQVTVSAEGKKSVQKGNDTGENDVPELKADKPKQSGELRSDVELPGVLPATENIVKELHSESPKTESGMLKEKIIPETSDQKKIQLQQNSKPSVDAPYNPYAEEGEVNEKPIIPGSFSPNNDGLNDRFEINIENERFYSLMILNEKGELVFESRNKQLIWDGKHYKTGGLCPRGNYIYVFKYQFEGSEKLHEKSGMIGLFF